LYEPKGEFCSAQPASRPFSASEDDVFLCPGVDLAAVGAVEFLSFDFGRSPVLLFNGLTGLG
jgi:hypothetical protein